MIDYLLIILMSGCLWTAGMLYGMSRGSDERVRLVMRLVELQEQLEKKSDQ